MTLPKYFWWVILLKSSGFSRLLNSELPFVHSIWVPTILSSRKALRNLLVLVLHQPELVIAPADADTADAEEDEIKEDEEVKDEDEGQKETQDCRCYKFFGICFLLFFFAGVFFVLIVSSHF